MAQAVFTPVTAYYTLDSSGPFNFTFIPNGPAMTVSIIPTAPAFKVGDSTPFGTGTGEIIYNVLSQRPITGIDLVLQGNVNLFGEVNWTETAEDGAGNLGSIVGSWRGSSYAGGVDGGFTQTARLNFNHAVTAFTVKKSFFIDIGANRPPSPSVAEISLIEQNLVPVPEPGTIAGLVLGAGALLARRRKKS
jgi:hypothetical protein